MKLQTINGSFIVCKLSDTTQVDFSQEFVFLSKTDDEISLVCEAAYTPPNTTAIELGWRGFKVMGVLDFSMIGVIAKISAILAAADISIFVVSTYNTDYIFVKSEVYDKCAETLVQEGYKFVNNADESGQ